MRTSRSPVQTAPAPQQIQWIADLPAGWTLLPPRPMVDVGWSVAGREDTTCTFSILAGSILAGSGGGLLANVNRWRGQMGLEPLTSEEAVAALPKDGPFLGRDAIVVDLVGSYGGMSGDAGIAAARMLGWIVTEGQDAAFLKLVGPKDVVDAEQGNLARVGRSLRPDAKLPPPSQDEMPAGHPPIEPELPAGHPPMGPGTTSPGMGAPGMPPPAPTESALTWTAPQGWVQKPPRMMREVTFAPAGSTKAECYVALAGGDLAMNVNRWRGQMGQAPLSEAEIQGLRRIPVLGGEAYFLEIGGDFSGMGAADTNDAVMFGVVLERPDQSVFVKMLGPKDEVLPERANFEAFVRSLEFKGR